ncbi:MAG: class I mannose-6-phosphate isomerase [Opitutaceae bacterium]|nr:class I mannose-6-phosphate isomerase [Opitutaceae bacterium]
MTHRHKLILLPPNRVWRTYPGGRTLDTLAGVAAPADSHFSEDWIASTTRAVNRGREHLVEGISAVRIGLDPAPHDLAALIARDPEYFLGAAHVRKYGAEPQLLVKFLDSGTRLHFQVHPTREFARRVLGAPSGKTEAYYVLGTREAGAEASGYIYVGFQRPPTPAQLRAWILTQDIAAIEACFDPIPVRPGDAFIIPGGTPHALGAGVFMVEIQEPSDLVIRFEFERAGYVLPEAARFMGRDVDFALSVFNFAPLDAAALAARVRCTPRRIRDLGAESWQEELIGPAQTDCFRVVRTRLAGPVVKDETSAAIAIVTSGAVTAVVGGESHRLDTYEKCLFPAGLGPVQLTPAGGAAELLECFPPA